MKKLFFILILLLLSGWGIVVGCSAKKDTDSTVSCKVTEDCHKALSDHFMCLDGKCIHHHEDDKDHEHHDDDHEHHEMADGGMHHEK